MKHNYLTLLLVFVTTITFSQSEISAVIKDSTNLQTIPFSSITLNEGFGVISNNEGYFVMHLKKSPTEQDTLQFSCLGYETLKVAASSFKDSIVLLSPKTFELHEVVVTKENLTAEEIIERVKTNLKLNYDTDYIKSTLFYRESQYTDVLTKEINLKKSTIPEFNQGLIDSILAAMPEKSDHYTEVLSEKYSNHKIDDGYKLDILKASELYDKNNEITFESFEERLTNIIKNNVKPDSYFKIKSGLFGTKEEMDSTLFQDPESKEAAALIEEEKKKEKDRKENFLKWRRNGIKNLENSSLIYEEPSLNFLEKSKKYRFTLEDYAFLNNNYVYKISFVPKGTADYKGTMYINPQDFGIERLDFENVKNIKSFKLLGLMYQAHLHKGTFIYAKNTADKYVLTYAESTMGNRFGIKRPLKIIEKNKNIKGRRKQNEVSGDLNFQLAVIEKKELVVFESSAIEKNEFDTFKEAPKVTPTYLPHYDPEFWNGYNVIEPNQAIKEFKSVE
ncbi:hypothetical protein KH5_03730 [Urechidicola sp. KH5]